MSTVAIMRFRRIGSNFIYHIYTKYLREWFFHSRTGVGVGVRNSSGVGVGTGVGANNISGVDLGVDFY
jgi:hypothetical protein